MTRAPPLSSFLAKPPETPWSDLLAAGSTGRMIWLA